MGLSGWVGGGSAEAMVVEFAFDRECVAGTVSVVAVADVWPVELVCGWVEEAGEVSEWVNVCG